MKASEFGGDEARGGAVQSEPRENWPIAGILFGDFEIDEEPAAEEGESLDREAAGEGRGGAESRDTKAACKDRILKEAVEGKD